MKDMKPTSTQDLLEELARMHMRSHSTPSPQNPEAFGWRVTAGVMAALAARALYSLDTVAPSTATEISRWFDGPLGEGPMPEEHTAWTARFVARTEDEVERWAADAKRDSREAARNAARAAGGDAAQGWDRAEFRCGLCGARLTATTTAAYATLVTAHHDAHFVWDKLDAGARDGFLSVLRQVLEADDLFRQLLVIAKQQPAPEPAASPATKDPTVPAQPQGSSR
ncbi:hypothetical protein [Streptomyces albidoflavus]|uniref:hypothetical protein n=1 Tax=Streptomyces albidoflavus TaxID=1886 RepID=UPI002F91BBE1|nr:hypothetical protein OH730_31280 [Streptomyces albidoflavus]WTD86103.1 hypothetical protein OHA92_30725 [Streptomyces albidoflavus]